MSSPLAYIQFFHKEYLASSSVRRLTLSARGLYIDLLCFQWEDGWIPDDIAQIARMVGATPQEIKREWSNVRALFEECAPGQLRQKRMHQDREEAIKMIDRAKANGAKGAANRWGAPKGGPCQPYSQPYSDGYRDTIRSANGKNKDGLKSSDSQTIDNPEPITEPELNTPPYPLKGEKAPWWFLKGESPLGAVALRLASISIAGGKRPYGESQLPEARLQALLDRVAKIDPGGCFASLLDAFAEHHEGKKKSPYKDPIRALGDWVTTREGTWANAKRARLGASRVGNVIPAIQDAEQLRKEISSVLKGQAEQPRGVEA